MDEAQGGAASTQQGPMLGALSAVMGVLACLGVAVIWLLSTTSLDLPGWLRILSGWMFPIGVLASAGLGIAARVRRSGPVLALAGLVLSGLAVVAFIAMIATVQY